MTATRCGEPAGQPDAWLGTASALLPQVERDIVARIRTEVPEYSVDRDGLIGVETRSAVHEAVVGFVAAESRSGAGAWTPDDRCAAVFRRLGRREARAGRSHDALQSAYRVASQSVVHHLLRWEHEREAPSEVLGSVSSAAFEFISELARCSAEGHTEALSAQTDSERLRAELVAMLVARDGFSRRVVTEAATRIGWAVPTTVAVVELVVGVDDVPAPGVLGDALVGRVGDRWLAVLPGPVDLAELGEQVAAAGPVLAIVGPTVPIAEAAASSRLVQRLRARHDLRHRAADGVITCQDNMVDLMLDCGRDVGRAMVSTRLAPLMLVSPAKRLKYGRLLSAWLEYGTLNADEPDVLDKHRQTLRYQCNRLEEMFGDELKDRTARLEIMLALRAALPLWERQAPTVAR